MCSRNRTRSCYRFQTTGKPVNVVGESVEENPIAAQQMVQPVEETNNKE